MLYLIHTVFAQKRVESLLHDVQAKYTVNFVYNDTPGTKIVSVVIYDRHYIHRDGYNDVLPRMRRYIRYDGYNDGFYEDASL